MAKHFRVSKKKKQRSEQGAANLPRERSPLLPHINNTETSSNNNNNTINKSKKTPSTYDSDFSEDGRLEQKALLLLFLTDKLLLSWNARL